MDRYHTRLPFTEVATLQQATALGRIDFWIVKGWVPPEEWPYPQVQEALSAWTIIRHDGSVLHNPSFADIASAHGIEVQPAD